MQKKLADYGMENTADLSKDSLQAMHRLLGIDTSPEIISKSDQLPGSTTKAKRQLEKNLFLRKKNHEEQNK